MVWKGLMLKKWIKLASRSIGSVPFINIHNKPVIGSFLKKTHENNDNRDHRASLSHRTVIQTGHVSNDDYGLRASHAHNIPPAKSLCWTPPPKSDIDHEGDTF